MYLHVSLLPSASLTHNRAFSMRAASLIGNISPYILQTAPVLRDLITMQFFEFTMLMNVSAW